MVHHHVPTPLPMLPHLHSRDTRRAHSKTSRVFHHNGAMPAISSAGAAIDASRRLADALDNPALTAPFAHFGAQIMGAIKKLAEIFSASRAPTPTPILTQRRTRTTTLFPTLEVNVDPHTPPRVPLAVPPGFPPQMVGPPSINPPHRYPLR